MWCLACQHCSSGLHNFLDQKALDCLLVHVQTDLRGVKLHRLNQEGLSCLLQLWVYIIHYHEGGTVPGVNRKWRGCGAEVDRKLTGSGSEADRKQTGICP